MYRIACWTLAGLTFCLASSLSSQEDSATGPLPQTASPEPESQAPSGETEPAEGEADSETREIYATLLITADSACNVYVNGVLEGSIASPEDSLEIEVESSTVKLFATSTVVVGASFEQDEDDVLELEKDEVREFAIPMLEAIEEMRKLERRERVWRDLDRGLMWPRRDNGADLIWARAEAYCEDLDLGGFENWRLPTVTELETIEAMWSIRPYKVVDAIFLTSCCAWSATQPTAGTAFNVNFRYRRRFEGNRNLSYSLRALCVRNMLAGELAESLLAADPKERKRRLKEKRRRQDERKLRKAERAKRKAMKETDGG